MVIPVSFDRTNITFDSTGYTWDATSEETNINVTPGAGALLVDGFAPSIEANPNVTVFAFSGELIVTGFAPVVFASDTKNFSPQTGVLSIAGFQPTIKTHNKTAFPSPGVLIITGYAPTVRLSDKTIAPITGGIIIKGFSPTVTALVENNCQSDNTRLKRVIRGSENTMSDLYSLISGKLSRYFEVLANCCAGKCNKLRELERLLEDYNSSEDQYNDIVLDVIDNIIDKLLEDTPEVAIQYSAAFYKEVCAKVFITDPATPPDPPEPPLKNASLYLKATFYGHVCRLIEEPLPDYTYEATYGNFVCSYDDSELFPYAYEATFMGHQCILRDGNYFYPEYSASFVNFVCEFEPACDTFSAVLCTSSELCELSMTSEWLDYSCFIAEQDFDISFFDHACIKNMAYEASFQNYVCIQQDWLFTASFIDFVCVLAEEIVTTTTTEAPVTTTTTTEQPVTTTTSTTEVTTTTTTESGIYPVSYGLIYNGYAMLDSRNIAPVGWQVFNVNIHYTPLINAYGGSGSVGNAIREIGDSHWNSPNTGATNASGLNGKGSGTRSSAGDFALFRDRTAWWCKGAEFGSSSYDFTINNSSGATDLFFIIRKSGSSIILVKDSTTLINGQTSFMVGNNGNIYRTVCVSGFEFTADPIAETLFRDGSPIPLVENSTEWAALTTPAYCYPNGDVNNV